MQTNDELTAEEQRIFNVVMKGVKEQEMELVVGRTAAPVRTHLESIFRKLGVSNTIELILYGYSQETKGSLTRGKSSSG